MKTCIRCGKVLNNPNPYTKFCKACDSQNVKGPHPPARELSPQDFMVASLYPRRKTK